MWPTGLSRRTAKEQLARIDAAMADDTCRFPVLVTTKPVDQPEPEHQEQITFQECSDCLTTSEFAHVFLCHGCEKQLCNICGSYGLDDHQCTHCLFSFCLECRGEHLDQCMAHSCSNMAGELEPAGPKDSAATLTEQQQKKDSRQ